MTITDAAPIVTRRFDVPDAHTLQGYLATGGYEGLKKALEKTPAEALCTLRLKVAGETSSPAARSLNAVVGS